MVFVERFLSDKHEGHKYTPSYLVLEKSQIHQERVL